MVRRSVTRLTGADGPEAAWSSLFQPGEIVGLKFNNVSKDFTGANQALLDATVAGLGSAGVPPEDIVLVEAKNVRFEGRPKQGGWTDEQYDFGSGKTVLSRFITQQVDAVVNVANLKDHDVAAFTGCLKNISHSWNVITKSHRFHDGACNPYIADINMLEPVRSRLRLHIMNGLKGIFAKGPGPTTPQFQWEHNRIMFSFDPVAVDTIGAELVDRARAEHGGQAFRRDPRPLRYLATAAERGLGTDDPARIERVLLEV